MPLVYERSSLGHLEGLQNNTNARWWKDAGLRKLLFWHACIMVSQMTAGYDESLIGSLQAMKPWHEAMSHPDSDDIGLIGASIFMGGFAAAYFASPLGDRCGRRAVLALGSFSCLIGGVIQSAAQGRGMYIGGRLLIGIGAVCTTNAGPTLLNELAHPRMRGTVTPMFNIFWYIGSIIASWTSFGTGHLTTSWSWRIPSIIQGIPALFVLLSTVFMPESPRYLFERGQKDRALVVLAQYHANGLDTDPLVRAEFAEIAAAISQERSIGTANWRKYFTSPSNRHRLGIAMSTAIFVLWSGQSAITYYLSPILTSIGIKTTNQQTGINGGMQIWNLAWSITGAFLADRLGRRTLWLTSFVGMLCANVPFVIAFSRYVKGGSKAAGYVAVIFLFFYNAGYNIGCNPLPYAYSSEIMPYSIRTRGMAVYIATANGALIANAYVMPIALGRIRYWMFVVYAGILVLALVVIWLRFPETKGRTLEEIAELFGEGNVAECIRPNEPQKGSEAAYEEGTAIKKINIHGNEQM